MKPDVTPFALFFVGVYFIVCFHTQYNLLQFKLKYENDVGHKYAKNI